MRKILLTLMLLTGGLLFAQMPTLPLDFESTTVTYSYTDFNGGAATVIANPDMSGINMSANVTQMVKNAGEVWGGSWIQLAGPIDFSTNKIFKAKVWSPRVGARMLLKVENATNGAINFEREDTTTTANAWEELTWDFSAIDVNNTYEKVVVIFDLGVMGDGTSNFTFYFDDINNVMGGGGPTLNQIDLPVTFEDTTVDYTLTDFGGNVHMIVPDPTNSSNTVAQVEKTGTAELWAGTTISTALGFANPIPFSMGNTIMSVDVWSPDASIPIRLKAEDHTNNQVSVETETMVTMASMWETMEFDFSNEVANTAAIDFNNTYDMASIFFNFGTDGATAGAKTYYFDNVQFGSVVISNDPARENLRYFPNPATDQLNIRSDRPINSVQVFDLAGKEMMRLAPTAQNVNVDVSNLAPGMYIFTTNSDGKSDTFRVVVQ